MGLDLLREDMQDHMFDHKREASREIHTGCTGHQVTRLEKRW